MCSWPGVGCGIGTTSFLCYPRAITGFVGRLVGVVSTNTKTCTVQGCERNAVARGWCNLHYLRWKKYGDPLFERPASCSAESCDRPVKALGLCNAHYLRARRGAEMVRKPVRVNIAVHAETCEVGGCERPYYAAGLCRRHYDRQRQAGHPLAPDRRVSFDPFTDQFWEHVDASGGPGACWPWLNGHDGYGYGTLERGEQTYQAHRVAYALAHGPLPTGLYVLHHCDNPPCCNPAHLFLGTQADNMADMASKGRGRSGNRPGAESNNAKLTAAQVAEIRARYPAETQRKLATEFDVHPSAISRIIAGKRW